MTNKTLTNAVAAVLFGSLALVGCKKADPVVTPPPVAVEPAPAPAPEPAPTPAAAPFTVSSVDLGNAVGTDNRVTTPSTTFARTDGIHASVATDGAAGGTLNAKWSFQDGQVVHTEDKAVPAGPQVTEFQITKPDAWPVGNYKLEVSLNGAVVQTREFSIK